MSIINEARDVLAKWRKNVTSPLPWTIENDGQDNIAVDAKGSDLVMLSSREVASWASLDDDDARLIVGIAGNPDLLDAIDGLLADYVVYAKVPHRVPERVQRIAAAIIAANKRMEGTT